MTAGASDVVPDERAPEVRGRQWRRPFVETHLLFWLLLAGGTLLRLATIVGYRPSFIYPDSLYYLTYAADVFKPGDARSTGYSIFIKPLLALQGIDLIVIVQHLMGLLLAGAVYVFLLRWGCGRFWSAVATLPLLLDSLEVIVEHYVLSDFLANTLMAAGLLVIGWARRTDWWLALASGAIIGCATIVRSGSVLVAVVVGLFVLASRTTWTQRLVHGTVLTAAFFVPVVSYMTWMNAERDTFSLTKDFSGRFLYGRVVVFADCRELDLPEYERPLCPKYPPDPHLQDYYMWNPQAPQWNLRPPPGKTPNEVAGDFAKRILKHQPVDYLKSVARDIFYNFAAVRGTGPENHPNWFLKYQENYPADPVASQETVKKYGGSDVVVHPSITKPLHWYGKAYVPGFLFGLCLLAGIAGGILARRSRMQLVALLFAVGTIAALLMPAMFSIFSLRYMLVQLVLAPIAGVLGGTALWSMRRSADADAGD